MTIENNVKTAKSTEPGTSRKRYWTFWILAVTSTLLFLFFVTSMLMVPGVMSSSKIWMLTVAGVGVAVSLGVGMWRFGSTEAPATVLPLGPAMGVLLLLELAYCAVNVVLLATTGHL